MAFSTITATMAHAGTAEPDSAASPAAAQQQRQRMTDLAYHFSRPAAIDPAA